MGLFSSLRKTAVPAPATDDLARAMLTVPVLVAFADRHIDEREASMLIPEALKMQPFSAMGFQRTLDLCKAVALDLQRRGGKVLMNEALPHLNMGAREAAFIFACRIAAADGRMADEEIQTLINLAWDMGISSDRLNQLLDAAIGKRAA
jgi:tellurite resistance protein